MRRMALTGSPGQPAWVSTPGSRPTSKSPGSTSPYSSPVGGAPLRTNNIPWNALIGRDVIRQFELCVDGVTGMITFLKEEEDAES